jgi:hypothetical protein
MSSVRPVRVVLLRRLVVLATIWFSCFLHSAPRLSVLTRKSVRTRFQFTLQRRS